MIFDTVIVGAGMGGLSCALPLAKDGFSVLIIEKNKDIGGNASCFIERGLRFEYAVHQVGGLLNKYSVGSILERYGLKDSLKAIKIDDIISIYYPTKRFSIRSNLPSLLDALNQSSCSKDNERYIKFLEDVYYMINHYCWFSSLSSTDIPEFPLKMLYRGWFSTYRFIKSLQMTSKEFNLKYFRNIASNDIAYFLSPYYGLPPSKSCATINICGTVSYLCHGSYYPEGGTTALTDVFVRKLQ